MCFLPLFFFKHSLPILGHVNWSGVCSRETEPVIGTDTQRGEGGVDFFFKRLVHVIVKRRLECQAGNPG